MVFSIFTSAVRRPIGLRRRSPQKLHRANVAFQFIPNSYGLDFPITFRKEHGIPCNHDSFQTYREALRGITATRSASGSRDLSRKRSVEIAMQLFILFATTSETL